MSMLYINTYVCTYIQPAHIYIYMRVFFFSGENHLIIHEGVGPFNVFHNLKQSIVLCE